MASEAAESEVRIIFPGLWTRPTISFEIEVGEVWAENDPIIITGIQIRYAGVEKI